MQRILIAAVILFLVSTSVAMAEELCRTTHVTIITRSVDVMIDIIKRLNEPGIADRLELMEARGLIRKLKPGSDLYVKEKTDPGPDGWHYLVRVPDSQDLFLALAPKGFDCPTPEPKRPTKKPKRP
jgi:hypothetical protein